MPQVRKMTKEDLDQVAAIAALAFVKPWSRQGFAEALPMENACFLVADDNGSVAGYCGLYMAADEGEIINVAVKPDFRRKGIADQLMKALLTEGIRNGVCRFFWKSGYQILRQSVFIRSMGLSNRESAKIFIRKSMKMHIL